MVRLYDNNNNLISSTPVANTQTYTTPDGVTRTYCDITVPIGSGFPYVVAKVNSVLDGLESLDSLDVEMIKVSVIPATPFSETVSVPGQNPVDPIPYAGVPVLSVRAGVELHCAASGIINFAVGDGQPSDPDGTGSIAGPDSLAPSLILHSLIGSVGGIFFQLGTNAMATAPASGMLYLYPNDSYYGDNSGSWSATISGNQQ